MIDDISNKLLSQADISAFNPRTKRISDKAYLLKRESITVPSTAWAGSRPIKPSNLVCILLITNSIDCLKQAVITWSKRINSLSEKEEFNSVEWMIHITLNHGYEFQLNGPNHAALKSSLSASLSEHLSGSKIAVLLKVDEVNWLISSDSLDSNNLTEELIEPKKNGFNKKLETRHSRQSFIPFGTLRSFGIAKAVESFGHRRPLYVISDIEPTFIAEDTDAEEQTKACITEMISLHIQRDEKGNKADQIIVQGKKNKKNHRYAYRNSMYWNENYIGDLESVVTEKIKTLAEATENIDSPAVVLKITEFCKKIVREIAEFKNTEETNNHYWTEPLLGFDLGYSQRQNLIGTEGDDAVRCCKLSINDETNIITFHPIMGHGSAEGKSLSTNLSYCNPAIHTGVKWTLKTLETAEKFHTSTYDVNKDSFNKLVITRSEANGIVTYKSCLKYKDLEQAGYWPADENGIPKTLKSTKEKEDIIISEVLQL